jgi:hypothetical protein
MMKTKMKIKRAALTFSATLMFSAGFGCNYNSFEKPNVNAAPLNAADQKTVYESDLQTMRTANMKYIFVFRRTDGGVFDSEDKRYLRANLPTINRIYFSDENKAFIVGTNYKFPSENLEILRLRFNVEENLTAEVK